MGMLIAAKDWQTTPLGPLASWPQSLKSAVSLTLASPVAMIVLWGPELIQLYNDSYATIAGLRHPAALGQPNRECWPEVWAFNAPIFAAALQGNSQSFTGQELVIERHGVAERAWFDLTYSPLYDEGGTAAGVLVIVIETTGRVYADQQVTAAVRRQRRLFERAPGFIAILHGPEMAFEFVNDAFTRLFGGRNFIGRTVRDAFPDLVGQGFYELLDNAYANGERFVASDVPIQLQNLPDVPPDERFLDFIYEPILNDHGQATGLFIEGHDVTDAHVARAALQALNADLERQVAERTRELGQTWQVSPDLLGILTQDGYFETTNPAWQVVLGWSAAELAASVFLDFIHPDDLERTNAQFERSKHGELALRFENRYRRRDGEYRWLSWVAVPGGGKLYCSARDVTTEKQQAEALGKAEEALRQSQKMEAVGQLTAGLAHDFNNLLTGISGSLELLQNRLAQGRVAGIERYLTAAQGASSRAAALTHRLLAFSRQQTLVSKPTDLNLLVAGMEGLVRRAVGPSIDIDRVTEAKLWTTLIDPGQLENALLNLCINARDAMPEGGRLVIETANRALDANTARRFELPEGDYVSLSVGDTGCGMTPEVVRRAFDPFFTTKPPGLGTGLGLSMIHGFVHQSGGQIRITSKPGQGTTVCLYLRRHHGGISRDDAASGRVAARRAGAGETVLVVEDEPTIRMLMTEVLEDLGYAAIESADGLAGLRIVRSGVRIDLLITDVGLPGGMNGRHLADAARALRPGLRVLFITGYAEVGLLSHGDLDPGMHVLTKPFPLDLLVVRIRELLAGP